jgi:hypothetical protein
MSCEQTESGGSLAPRIAKFFLSIKLVKLVLPLFFSFPFSISSYFPLNCLKNLSNKIKPVTLSLSNNLFIYLFSYFTAPELQGKPEDISKEKARLAAIEVLSLSLLYHMHICMYVCLCIAN